MTTLKSGIDATVANVDPNSKALRITPYDTSGLPLNPGYTIYQLPIQINPTTFTGGTTYWAMRNIGAKTCYLRGMSLNLSLWAHLSSGSAAVTTGSRANFDLTRFATATPTGGTALTVVKRRTSDAASSVTDARQTNGALTPGSMTFEPSPFAVVGVTIGSLPNPATVPTNGVSGNTAYATVTQQFDFSNGGEEGRIALLTGEGLCIRANGTVPANAQVIGTVWWDER